MINNFNIYLEKIVNLETSMCHKNDTDNVLEKESMERMEDSPSSAFFPQPSSLSPPPPPSSPHLLSSSSFFPQPPLSSPYFREHSSLSQGSGLGCGEKIHLYLHCMGFLKEIYSDFLESLDCFLNQHGYSEISSCQALIVYAIGERFLSLQDLCSLTSKSNASYHGRKLLLQGYIHYNTNPRDKRMLAISLTPQGQGLCKHLSIFFQHHLHLFQELFHMESHHWSFFYDQGKKLQSFYHSSLSWQLQEENQKRLNELDVLKPKQKENKDFKISSKTRYAPKHEILGLWMKEYKEKELLRKNQENKQ